MEGTKCLFRLDGSHPDVSKDRIQGLHRSNTSCVFLVVEFLHGRHVSTSSRSSSGPNLRIQILHKLTYKMQVGIPIAYNVCEVKTDNITIGYVHTERNLSVSVSILKLQFKSRIIIRCVKTTERSDCVWPL